MRAISNIDNNCVIASHGVAMQWFKWSTHQSDANSVTCPPTSYICRAPPLLLPYLIVLLLSSLSLLLYSYRSSPLIPFHLLSLHLFTLLIFIHVALFGPLVADMNIYSYSDLKSRKCFLVFGICGFLCSVESDLKKSQKFFLFFGICGFLCSDESNAHFCFCFLKQLHQICDMISIDLMGIYAHLTNVYSSI